MGKKICLVLGTRPEIVKMSPIIRYCIEKDIDFFIFHTGQHYTQNMDAAFFEDLQLPKPRYHMKTKDAARDEQIKEMVSGISRALSKEQPDVVLVQGDTNSVLAGALAAHASGIAIGHVEAGLRSHDLDMPEEVNRTITDHLSDCLFAPTRDAQENITKEYISRDRIYVTGNTIVDAVRQNAMLAKRSTILKKLSLEKNKYILATSHRRENVDNKERFESIIKALDMLCEKMGVPVIYPIHPRAKKMMKRFGIKARNVKLIEPLGFLDFLNLEQNSRIILTDSGGLQEEACILGVPCVTMRENTERPETISVGANMLAGTDAKRIVAAAGKMIKKNKWKNPLGDGFSTERIMKIVMK